MLSVILDDFIALKKTHPPFCLPHKCWSISGFQLHLVPSYFVFSLDILSYLQGLVAFLSTYKMMISVSIFQLRTFLEICTCIFNCFQVIPYVPCGPSNRIFFQEAHDLPLPSVPSTLLFLVYFVSQMVVSCKSSQISWKLSHWGHLNWPRKSLNLQLTFLFKV